MKRLVVLLLVISFCFAPTYADFEYGDDYTYGSLLRDRQIINGDADGDLNEDKLLTREELITILVRLTDTEKPALMGWKISKMFQRAIGLIRIS